MRRTSTSPACTPRPAPNTSLIASSHFPLTHVAFTIATATACMVNCLCVAHAHVFVGCSNLPRPFYSVVRGCGLKHFSQTVMLCTSSHHSRVERRSDAESALIPIPIFLIAIAGASEPIGQLGPWTLGTALALEEAYDAS